MTPIALLALGSLVAGCSSTPAPLPRVQSPCLVDPGGDSAVGRSPVEPIRILVADSASLARFVRQPDRMVVDCEGRAHSELAAAGESPAVSIDSLPAGTDPRDLLDRGAADLMITRDPATLAYARNRRDLMVVALPWDLVYVLTVRSSSDSSLPTEAEWTSLATEVVQADARAPSPPFWWRAEAGCGTRVLGSGDQVGYGQRDPIARALAQRIVALAAMNDPPVWLGGKRRSWRVASVRSGNAEAVAGLGGLVSTHSRMASPPDGCSAGQAALPLLDSRPSLIVRRGVRPFLITSDGTVAFIPRAGR